MTYNWNPWHGCHKKSEGCMHCYMYYLDKVRNADIDSSKVHLTNQLDFPLQKDRRGEYKIRSKDYVYVCMTSDFFLSEADEWRNKVWDIIRIRKDVIFSIFTKRPERILECLPTDWEDGYDNVIISVSCENQKRVDERIPILMSLPIKHKGIICSPLIEDINLDDYLEKDIIEEVSVSGENYEDARICDFDWVKHIYDSCIKYNVNFDFFETGMNFRKDGKIYHMNDKRLVREMAIKSGLSYYGRDVKYTLYDEFMNEI